MIFANGIKIAIFFYLFSLPDGMESSIVGPERLTEVWHMAHFWVSSGRCTMPASPMGRSEGFPRRWTG